MHIAFSLQHYCNGKSSNVDIQTCAHMHIDGFVIIQFSNKCSTLIGQYSWNLSFKQLYTKHPIWKSLQLTSDLQVHSRSSQLLLLGRLCITSVSGLLLHLYFSLFLRDIITFAMYMIAYNLENFLQPAWRGCTGFALCVCVCVCLSVCPYGPGCLSGTSSPPLPAYPYLPAAGCAIQPWADSSLLLLIKFESQAMCAFWFMYKHIEVKTRCFMS